jgi:putative transposase
MPKKINYQLSKEELEQIEKAQRTSPDPRVRQRATGLRLLHGGKKPSEVAKLLNVSQATVFNWHADWRADGLDGLRDKPRSGRPPLADEAYRAQVEAVMETDPTSLGYGFTCWTLQRLIAHLARETGIQVSVNTMRRVLEEQDYVCRRPKHELKPLQDVEARTRAKELLDELKKKPKRTRSNYSLWTKRP